jgi:hypothetical protein
MNSRTLAVLAVVTLLLVIVAVLAYSRRSAPGDTAAADVLFPGLSDRVNDVRSIIIDSDGATLSIGRVDDEWGLAEKGGYPVEFEKVKQAIMSLAELKIVEPKTSKADFYDRLGVQEPGAGSSSKRVTLANEEGGTIAAVVVGNRAEGQLPRYYVRREGEPQAWLVGGDLEITSDALSWIDAQIVLVARDRIQAVTTNHPDGEELHVHRQSKDETDFEVDDIPDGLELRYAGIAGSIGSAGSFLRSEDVQPETEIACGEDGDTIAEFRTFDGLLVTAWTCTAGDDDAIWARFHADTFEVPDGGTADEAGPDPAADAERINARLDGWRFRISASQASNLRKRLADLTQAVRPDETAVPAGESGATPVEAAPPG